MQSKIAKLISQIEACKSVSTRIICQTSEIVFLSFLIQLLAI